MATIGELMIRAGIDIEGITNGVLQMSRELDGIGSAVDRQVRYLDRLGDRAKEIGAGLTASLTLPIAGVALAAGKMAEDFELSMRKVTSLLGDDAAKSFQPLNDGVLALSKSMGIDAVGAANALYEAISAGIPKENALEFLEVASKAAIAGVTSTKVAVDGMTNVINAYGLSISEAGKLSDAMFQSVNIGKFSFEQLAASIGQTAGTAATLKVSYQELLAAAATITKQGFTVSEAMTMQQSAMKALIVPHKQMIELIEKTGYASGVALIQAKGFEGALQAISTAAGGSVETLAAAYGRIEGLKASLALTGVHAKEAAKDLDSITNSAGAMGKAFDEINKSFSRQMDTFMARLKALGIEIGTALLPVGQDILKSLTPMLDTVAGAFKVFQSLPMPVKEAALALVALAAAAGPVLYVIGGIATGIAAVAPAFAIASAAFATFSTSLSGISFAAISTGIQAMAVAFGDLSIAIVATAETVISRFFTVTIPAAGAALMQFAATAIPAAIAAIVEFATVGIPAAIAGIGTFATVTVPAATASLVAFASEGIAAAVAGISSLATAAMPALLATFAALGVTLAAIAAAFAAWKVGAWLGEWAYSNIPGFKALDDAIMGFVLKIPLLGSAIEKISGISAAQAAATAAEKQYADQVQKTAEYLKTKGIVVEQGKMSLDQYAKALRDAALAGAGMDSITLQAETGMKKLQASTKSAAEELKVAEKELSLIKKAYAVGAASAADVAAATELVRQAMVKVNPALTGTGKAMKDAGVSSTELAKAFEKLGTETAEMKVAKQIDALYGSLHALFKGYQEGKVSLDDYLKANVDLSDRLRDLDAQTKQAADSVANALATSFAKASAELRARSLEQVQIVTSIWDQMKSGAANGLNAYAQEVSVRIRQVFTDLKDIGNIFKSIGGTEADANASIAQIDANLNRIRQLYYGLAKDLQGNLLVSQADMERLEIDAGEKRIAIARKVGKDVTDAQIASLQGIKTAFTVAHMDIEQAWKTLGVTTTKQYDDQVRIATTAYEKIKNSALSSRQDILKGEAALYADQLSAQEAHGDRVTETQKRQLAKLIDESQHGVDTLAKQWDSFANHMGDAVSKGLDDLATDLLTGKKIGNIKDIFSKIWQDIAASFVKDMIHPITASIGTLISGAIKSLLGGNGLGGVVTAAKTAGEAIKTALGFGSAAANVAKTATGAASTGAGAASGVASAASGVMGIANVITGAVSAISGVIGNFQFAHMNTALGRIEASTREVSVVTWQTGAESIQGILKTLQNLTLQVIDRLLDLRGALFDPVAKDLEDIYKLLQSGVVTALHDVSSGVQEWSETAVYEGDQNAQDIQNQIQAGIDASGRRVQDVVDAVNSGASTTADAISYGSDQAAAATSYVADSMAGATNNLAGTITQSGGEVINALGQTGSAVVQATAQGTDAILQQLAALGSDMVAATGNAYTDLKTSLIGVKQSVDKSMLPGSETSKMFNDAIFGVTQNFREAAQMMGLEGTNDYIARTGGDNSNLFSGPAGYSVNAPLAAINAPVSLPLGAAGFSTTQNYGYVAPSPYTSAPTPGTAGYSRTPKAPIQYAPQGKAVEVNIYGNVTGYDEAQKMGTMMAENVTRALR